ncbi:hypothetical protein JTB14_024255 [Gonioctena quinquepunctata]|nr:hypothetical protein JTB14_024255 [Gonioctena quinquepunctata]
MGDKLNESFETVDLGYIPPFLGIRVQLTEDGRVLLDQKSKIDIFLKENVLENVSCVATPMDTEYPKFDVNPQVLPNNEKYRKTVGPLLYLPTTTRPDISLAVGYLCRRVSQPSQ